MSLQGKSDFGSVYIISNCIESGSERAHTARIAPALIALLEVGPEKRACRRSFLEEVQPRGLEETGQGQC